LRMLSTPNFRKSSTQSLVKMKFTRPTWPRVPPTQFPGRARAAELYLEAGIRSFEMGTLILGKRDEGGVEHPGPMDLLNSYERNLLMPNNSVWNREFARPL